MLKMEILDNAITSMSNLMDKVLDENQMSMLDDVTRLGLQAGVIKHFEICYELCWKFIQRWVNENYHLTEEDFPRSRKDLYRFAAKIGLIDDVEAWLRFGDARNLSVHVYDSKQAIEVYEIACSFISKARELYHALEKTND
jgi:nucleotidyltransferase substrate binding protein (TIGR01987 family)